MGDPLRLYGLNALVLSAGSGIGEAIARTLKSMRADSEQQLASAALAAEQAVADFDRRIAEQEQIVERAAVDVRAAHDRYRGADPIAGTAVAAAPEPMTTPNPTAGP